MSKVRVYELAKELNIDSKKVIEYLHDKGVEVNNHMKSLEDNEVNSVRGHFSKRTDSARPAAQAPENREPKIESPQQARPQQDRPQQERPVGDRPQQDRPQGDRPPRDPNRPYGDRPQGDRPPRDPNRPYGDRPQGDRPPRDPNRQYGDRPQGDRPPRDPNRPYGDRPQGDRPPRDPNRPYGDRPPRDPNRPYQPQGDRPPRDPNRPYGDRPPRDPNRPYQPQGDRPPRDPNRPYGDRPPRDPNRPYQPQGDRPPRDPNRPYGDRPPRDPNRPYQPQGDRPPRDPNRPYGDRPPRDPNRPYQPQGDRPPRDPNRPYGDRPPRDPNRPYQPQGDRPPRDPNRPYGDRPPRDPNRPYGDRPPRDPNRPYGDRPPRDPNRPYGDRPQGGGYNKDGGGGRPYGNRPQGPKKDDRESIEVIEKPKSRFEPKKFESPAKDKYKEDGNKNKKPVKRGQGMVDKSAPKLNELIREDDGDWVLDSEVNARFKRTKHRENADGTKTRGAKKEEARLAKEKEPIAIPAVVTVGDFAKIINKPAPEIIMKLMQLGTMATLNQEIDFEILDVIADDYGLKLKVDIAKDVQEEIDLDAEDDPKDLVVRAPIVTVMGHVDHGKTSLLDAIRNTNVIGGEAGGITQHIGASEVFLNDKKIVFLDTPGHEAFTSLRARGAKVTDIAILVVAADDGVMPQTIEAIDHAKAAGVPIIIALNKIDKDNADPDNVKRELAQHGLMVEDWGGEVVCVPVSAKKGENIDQLLEMVLLVADMQDLKANPSRPGRGTIIEAQLEKGRGPVATVIVETGTLKVGDPLFAGSAVGRIRAMYNHLGKSIKEAGPSSAVEITGLDDVPQAGDRFYVTRDDKQARDIAERKRIINRSQSLRENKHVSLEDLFSQIQTGNIKDLNIIVKADVHGSIEALKGSLEKITNEEVRVNVIHTNIGTITESDIMLASASNALIIGFNVRPMANVARMAEQEAVSIKTYSIIYEAINDVEAAMKGMLDPIFKEVVIGKVQVRTTFKVPNIGIIAGSYVTEGRIERNAGVRVVREGIVIHTGKISSLKRFKDDAKEVAKGYECGVGIEGFNDLKEFDEIEAFVMEEVKR